MDAFYNPRTISNNGSINYSQQVSSIYQQPSTYSQQQPSTYSQQQPSTYSQQQPSTYSQQQPPAYPNQQPSTYSQQQPPAYPNQESPSYSQQQPPAYPNQESPAYSQQQPPAYPNQESPAYSQQVAYPLQGSPIYQESPVYPQQEPLAYSQQEPFAYPNQESPVYPQQVPADIASSGDNTKFKKRRVIIGILVVGLLIAAIVVIIIYLIIPYQKKAKEEANTKADADAKAKAAKENVFIKGHTNFIHPANDEDKKSCLKNWTYLDTDGTTILEDNIPSTTTKGDVRPWCAVKPNDMKPAFGGYFISGSKNWKYIENENDKADCLRNWTYMSADGKTHIEDGIALTTKKNDTREWCATRPIFTAGQKNWIYTSDLVQSKVNDLCLHDWSFKDKDSNVRGYRIKGETTIGDTKPWCPTYRFIYSLSDGNWKETNDTNDPDCIRNWDLYDSTRSKLIKANIESITDLQSARALGDNRPWGYTWCPKK